MYSACRELLCRTVYLKKGLSKAKPPFEILRFAVHCDGESLCTFIPDTRNLTPET